MDSQGWEISRHIEDGVAFDNPYTLDEVRSHYSELGLIPVEYTGEPPDPVIELFWDHRDRLWVLRDAYEDGISDTSTMWPFRQLGESEQQMVRAFLWDHFIEI